MAVIRLHDSWARFCREVTIAAAADRPVTATGVQLARAPGIRKSSEVVPRLLSTYSKRRLYEPKWAHARECIDAAHRLGIANFPTVAAALGASNSPAEEINLVRNFFAHRCKDTALKIRIYSPFVLAASLDVESLVGEIIAPSTTRMEMWVLGLQSIAEAAIQ